MDSALTGLLVTTAVGAITGATTSLLNYLREGREHKWQREQRELEKKDREDQRELERRERLDTAAELKEHQEAAAQALAETAKRVQTTIVQKLDEAKGDIASGSAAAAKAYDAAAESVIVSNKVNNKLVAIGEARLTRENGEHNRRAEDK